MFVGCSTMDKSYIKGKGIKQDFKKAVQLLTKACEGGDMESCKLLKKLESKE